MLMIHLPRLDASDAEYVEIIQTEIVFWGIAAPIGHSNFYPAVSFVKLKAII